MIGNIIFFILFLIVIGLLAFAMVPRQTFMSRSREDRLRSVQRLYVRHKIERRRTKIITKDEQFIVGDGAWHTVKAEYPEVGA
jgi:hypothetical protein